MISEVVVQWSAAQQFRADVDRLPPMGNEEARRWLDEQFTALDCEPLRPSGKVLLADKVLLVARGAGVSALSDANWFHTYARAVHAVLNRPFVAVDVPAMSVNY
jgi:hypothetical protein